MNKKNKIEKIIVLRFSSLGDVAIVSSFLKEFVQQFPDTEILMVGKKQFADLFVDIPNVKFHSLFSKDKHKGFSGLYRLYKELKYFKPNAIADLHDSLRSRIVSSFFGMNNVLIKRIDKGRKEKHALTREKNKILKPLKPTIERYADVFRSLGFDIQLKHQLQREILPLPEKIKTLFNNTNKKISVSPFAQFDSKVYNINKMEMVLKALSDKGFQLFIFGGTNPEKEIADKWQQHISNIYNTIREYNLHEELQIISNTDLMLSMDSSGMHLASLVGIPVVSVWGGTHPFAGFLGYGQSYDDCLQIDDPIRPTSVYGNKPCICGEISCIDLINPEDIVEKIIATLNNNQNNQTLA